MFIEELYPQLIKTNFGVLPVGGSIIGKQSYLCYVCRKLNLFMLTRPVVCEFNFSVGTICI